MGETYACDGAQAQALRRAADLLRAAITDHTAVIGLRGANELVVEVALRNLVCELEEKADALDG